MNNFNKGVDKLVAHVTSGCAEDLVEVTDHAGHMRNEVKRLGINVSVNCDLLPQHVLKS